MGLMQLFAKVMFKRGTDAAARKIAEAVDRRKARNTDTTPEPVNEENVNTGTAVKEMNLLDKCLKYRFLLVVLFILGFAVQIIAGTNAGKYKATYQRVGDYHIKQYGEEPTEKKDYVRMEVVSAEPLMYLTHTTTSTGKYSSNSKTTLYDVYYVKDQAGRTALYCDITDNAFVSPISGSSYRFENKVPFVVTGKLTGMYDEFSSYQDYSKYVTKEIEQLDMIREGTPPDGVYEYTQSEEDSKKEQMWKTIKTVASYMMYISAGLFIILYIIGKVKNR